MADKPRTKPPKYDQERRHVRIPLYVRVEARGTAGPLGTLYSWNVSEGGLYLKAPDARAPDIPLGTRLSLVFSLPDGGPPLDVHVEVVWVDPAVRDHRGRRAVGLGVRLDDGQDAARAQIRRYIESFRYVVVALDFPDMELARRALGGLFQLEVVGDEEQLRAREATGHVGLVLLGQPGSVADGVARLRRVTAAAIERQPPLIYCGLESSQQLEDVVAKSGRVVYEKMPVELIELRTLVQRSVEAHVLAFENERLTAELERALERLRRENQYLRGRIQEPTRLEGLIGDSAAMRRVYEMVERVAALSTSVMIIGETGTGKDLVARAIHALSTRSHRPYVAQNCAALAETLLDSELFGHARGAFTGAVSERPGLFETADGGTVFLDEVGEMAPAMQAKLLRVLQDGEVRRVGSTKVHRVEVRVICATHRDLQALVREQRFREDLYYRLAAFMVSLPPLRERRGDIAVLAMHFLDRYAQKHSRDVAGISAEAMRLIEEHPWPGNVRELEHTMERLVVLCQPGAKIDAALVREMLGLGTAADAGPRSLDDQVADYERQLIVAEMERKGFVISEAARALGIDRTTLSKKCKRLGIRGG
jgi:transcriptional regulator with PAS, ATPase and Fis domain/Tfp pilus assembly protein PilZ